MPSNNKWIDNGIIGEESNLMSRVAMKFAGANALSLLVINPPLTHIIFGDYTKWCANLLFFPFDTTMNSTEGKLQVGGANTDVPAYMMNVNSTFGYTLGEYKYERIYNDFRDFEPYTKLQIYLPFYQFVDIPVADVINKYIQFRLRVDYITGQAVYYIGVSDESIVSPEPPYYLGTDDTNTRIIGSYTFQIGASIPLGQTGVADALRNIGIGALKTGATIGASLIGNSLGANKASSSTKIVKTQRNPKTGRQITTSTQTRETVYDSSNYQINKRISSVFDSAINSIESMQLNAHTGNANNILVDSMGSKSIKIVRKLAKVIDVDNEYNKLYGRPLGEVRMLKDLDGYTEITEIHLEGNGFGSATQKEKLMIQQAFNEGVILQKIEEL